MLIIDTSIIETSALFGKWELTEYYENEVLEEQICSKKDLLEINENGELSETIYNRGKTGDNGEIYRECVEDATPDKLQWSLNKRMMKFDYGGGDFTQQLITLITKKTLILRNIYQDEGKLFIGRVIYKKVQ